MYIARNVAKPAGKSAGAAAPKEPNVAIIAIKDIAAYRELCFESRSQSN
jgi:hypothetical protein